MTRRVVLGAAWAFLLACGGGSDGDSPAETTNGGASGDGAGGAQTAPPTTPGSDPEQLDPSVDWEALNLTHSPMYSAFDGQHVFSLPCFIEGVSTTAENWLAIPSDAVSFADWQSDDGSQVGVLITVERAVDEVTIAARDGAVGGTATLFVTEATPDDWEVGRTRYTTGDTFDLEALANDPALFERLPAILENTTFNEDGSYTFTGDAADIGLSSNMRCDTCHTTTADTFQVEHTPTQAALYSDEQLQTIFREGMKPEGIGFRALPENLHSIYPITHKWDATDQQIKGLIVYLRSLTPKGQGEVLLPEVLTLTSEDIPWEKFPASCNPMDPSFNQVLCLLELPPECNPTGLFFNQEMCEQLLDIEFPSFGTE